MSAEPELLDVEDVLEIHATQLEIYGGSAGIRDRGLLESAGAQPQASFGGQYVHEGLFAMAAAYLFHIEQASRPWLHRSPPPRSPGAGRANLPSMSISDPSAAPPRIGAARVAWYATGRFYVSTDGTLLDAGYFLHLGELRELFLDRPGAPPSEATARFTFYAAPWRSPSVTNGDLSMSLAPPGDFTLYYNPDAGADFGDPRSFARGLAIATFRRAEQVVTTTVSSGQTKLFGMNVFTADLVASRPFEHAGARCDLGAMLPGGVTQWGLAGQDPLPSPPPGVSAVVPFVGSAVAAAPRG